MNAKSMMTWGLGTLALACVACNKGEAPAAAGSATASAAAPAADPFEVAVGKAIIATSSPNSFTEGKVTAIEGTKVTYEYGEADKTTGKRPTYSVEKTKAFVIGIAPKETPKVGAFVVAKGSSSYWAGCEVKSADAGVLGCEDAYGKVNNVDPKTVVVADPATTADIKQALATAAKHRAFDEAAKASGKPVVAAGWKPKEKDSVAVEWMVGSWYAASVLKVDGDKITIKWDTKGWPDPAEKNIAQLAPVPTAAAKVKEGQFVLMHVGDQWPFHKVVSVAKDTAEVIDRDDKKTTANLKDLIAVGGT